MPELVLGIIVALAGLIGGGGGLLAYLNTRQKNKLDEQVESVSEWKALYEEMRDRYKAQEEVNKAMKKELESLKQQIGTLSIDLQSYQKYDGYIIALETYINVILNAIKPMLSNSAYNSLEAQRPARPVDIQLQEEGDNEGGEG